MADDSDPIIISQRSSIIDIFTDMLLATKWKHWLILFLLFILFTSDVFIKNALGGINGAEKNGKITNYGVILQATLLVFSMMAVDLLISGEIV